MDGRDVPRSRAGGAASGEVGRRLARVGAWLHASPAEVVGLAVLLLGGIACFAVLVWWSPAASRDPGPVAVAVPTARAIALTVHVTGAVAAPGVVQLPDGSRVSDAVSAAGGPTVVADLGALNLARVLTDGERIEVPTARAPGGIDAEAPPGDAVAPGGAFLADGRLDLNRADASDLETLPGIGPVLAARIVAHRESEGPFVEVGQLRDVSGIGERTFQTLADLVVVR